MEELYKLLGLDEGSPEASVVQAVTKLQNKLEDKNNIIEGLTKQIENLEGQVSSIAAGVAEARVKDLVRKVQAETGYHVGGDHMKTLQKKAAQHLYSGEEEQKSIWSDMKAHTIAYGAKVGMSKEIEALYGDRSEGDTIQDKRHAQAKKLVEGGKAKNWDEALALVLQQEEETKGGN